MTKKIQIIKSTGEITVLDTAPSLAQMQEIVGGYIEHVRVLDRIEDGRFIYTSMYVNERGLLEKLPRNSTATVIYQRNVRAQFPDHPQPFLAASEAYRKSVEAKGFSYIDGTPQDAKDQGYDADPYVVGGVIHFAGYTIDEVAALYEAMEGGQ